MKNILIIIFSFMCFGALAQTNLSSVQYSIGFGTGDLGDYIGSPSFRGFIFDYRRMVNDNVGVGAEIGWNVFYEELNYATYEQGNVALTGKQWRYNNQFPLLVAADYYFSPDSDLSPYAGLGIGTMYTRRNTDMNVYTFELDAWQFAIRPEVGVMYEVSPELALSATAKYCIGVESGDLPSQSYFTLNFGLVILSF